MPLHGQAEGLVLAFHRLHDAVRSLSGHSEARRDLLHYDMSKMARQLTVHYGVEFRKNLVKPYEELEKFKVIFSGGHHIDNGAQFLPEIARHLYAADPRIRLIITGGAGPTRRRLMPRRTPGPPRRTTPAFAIFREFH